MPSQQTNHPREVNCIAPIVHGTKIAVHHDETALYDTLRELWRTEIGDGENDGKVVTRYHPDHADDVRGIHLSSSGCEFGRDGRQWFKYHVKAVEPDCDDPDPTEDDDWKSPRKSAHAAVKPQKDGMKMVDDGEVTDQDATLPHGTGAQLQFDTTYPDGPDDVIERMHELMNALLDDDYNPGALDRDTASIIKFETHLRFNRDRMDAAVASIRDSHRIIGWMGPAAAHGYHKQRKGGWDIWKFTATDWPEMGFHTPEIAGRHKWLLKAYSANDWRSFPEDHPLHHPKIEAAYVKPIGDTKSRPPLSKWDAVRRFCNHIVINHARWAKIDEDDLVADDEFEPDERPTITVQTVDDDRQETLKEMYENRKTELRKVVASARSDVPREMLRLMLSQGTFRDGAVTYQTIREETGASQETVRRWSKRLEDAGIANRVSAVPWMDAEGNPGAVRFSAPRVMAAADDFFEELTADELPGESRDNSGTNTRRNWIYAADIGADTQTIAQRLRDGDLDPDEVRVVKDAIEADDD